MSKYGVISDPYFVLLAPNIGKYGPEITLYLDTFHAVQLFQNSMQIQRDLAVKTLWKGMLKFRLTASLTLCLSIVYKNNETLGQCAQYVQS